MAQFNYEGGESPVYNSIISVFENYGWYLLIIVILFLCIYQKFRSTINKYLEDRENRNYARHYHKNPDLFAARLDAQQTYAENLQKKYRDEALKYQQKLEEKETRKREEWLARQSGSSGHKLGTSNTSLKPEFNPLTGDTSSRSYKPQKKSACSGGGCGK